jgi:hypothetical protein
MGDLARFYMRRGLRNRELAARFWQVVEELAAEGDQAVVGFAPVRCQCSQDRDVAVDG